MLNSVFDIFWAHLAMINGRVMFSEIITVELTAWFPIEVKVLLIFLIPEPIVAHVPRFRTALMDVVMNKTIGG